MRLLEQADAVGARSSYHQHLKRYKRKVERRRAKLDPECQPLYRKFRGWET